MKVLLLNDMRGHSDAYIAVACAETAEALERFLLAETVEPYQDLDYHFFSGNSKYIYNKVFRRGGPLEWFNRSARIGNADRTAHLEQAGMEFDAYIATLLKVD